MKQRKNLKKLLSVIVSAVMMLSVLSIGAMATDSVPTSDVYTIDGNTIYVPKNTFVGDFLRGINSYGSVKKLGDSTGALYQSGGYVTEDMTLFIGDTSYNIEYHKLYDLAERLEQFEKDTVVFEWSYDESDENRVRLSNAVSENETIKKLFAAGLEGSSSLIDGSKITITVKEDENAKKYLELKTNSRSVLYFLTDNFDNYAKEELYGNYVVSELDIKQINYSGVTVKGTGLVSMGHYLTGKDGEEVVNAPSEEFLGSHSDFVFFNRQGYFNMGGASNTYKSASSFYVHNNKVEDENPYSTGNPYNVKQYTLIESPDNNTVTVSGLYLNDVQQVGYNRDSNPFKNMTTFAMPVSEGKSVEYISKGMLGVGTNGDGSNYGTETVAEIYNYSLYLQRTITSDESSFTSSKFTNNEKDANGLYVVNKATGVAAAVNNVLPGTTAKELIDMIYDTQSASIPHCMVWISTDGKDASITADDEQVVSGNYVKIAAPNPGAASRGYKITLATVDNATTETSGTEITASRKCSNTVLGTFVFAAYDENDKLVAAKTTTSADAEGVRSVTFDNSQGDISYVKSFVFNNMASLRPVVVAN